MERELLSIITVGIALIGMLLEIAATIQNNKEDPTKNNYYRSAIYTILLFWGCIY